MTTAEAILDPEDARSRWQELASVCPASSPFTNVDLVESLARLFGWRCRSIFTADAGAWLVERRTGWFREVVLPPFAALSAVLFEPGADLTPLFRTIGRIAPSALVSLSNEATMTALPPGWHIDQKATYVLDTTKPLETCWSSNPLRIWRRHQEDYEFVEGTDVIALTTEFIARAYRRHGRNMALAPGALQDLASHLSMARPVGVRNRETGDIEAGIVLLVHGDTAWYWLSGSEPGPAMTILVGKATAFLESREIRFFDLMGANTPSIAEFKRRFGGRLHHYPHYHRGPTPLLRLARSIRRKLP